MRSSVVLLTGLVTFASARARAAEPTAEDLIARGLELRRAAKPGEALAMFQRAHALAPSPRTLGQMGLVEASLERWLDAEAHVTAARLTPDEMWVRKNRALLDQALKVCRGHIGELFVTGPNGTNVAVDGRRVGPLPIVQPVRLVEGTVVVTASNTGFKDFSKSVTIPGGAKVSLAIVLGAVEERVSVAVAAPMPLSPAAAPTSPATMVPAGEPSARSWKTPMGVGLIAVGAGFAAWGITWIAVDHKDACPTNGPACNNVYDTRAKGWFLTAGGIAGAGAGATLLYLGRRSENTGLALDLTPSSIGLRGRF